MNIRNYVKPMNIQLFLMNFPTCRVSTFVKKKSYAEVLYGLTCNTRLQPRGTSCCMRRWFR